ncbi:MAG: DUF262 domain-containing protein [Chthoniobacterales bacterium]
MEDFGAESIDSNYGAEDESDLNPLRRIDVSSVSVSGTDWTTETLLSQMDKGNIELNPRFQRRDAWEQTRKSLFIESLILGLPVPQIVLAERSDARGKYIVLDGKQRLLCLRQFTATDPKSEFRSFKLKGLEIRPDLEGRGFSDFQSDFEFQADLTAFENQSIRTVVVRNWRSEALLFHVFLRLNRGSKPLSPQELRQALHPGPFLDFADESSTASRAIRGILRLSEPDFRMRDVELIIRFFSFKHRLSYYRGNLKDFLDQSCKEFNENWAALCDRFSSEMEDLESAHAFSKTIFGRDFNYSKWTGSGYERRFNRAVFDVVIAALTDPLLRSAIEADIEKAKVTYQALCEQDPRFIESIERTTKSLESTRYRFNSFYGRLAEAYQIDVQPPAVGA